MDRRETSSLPERFRTLRPLGRGGMGEVWLAEDLTNGARVALKQLLSARADAAANRLRFRREFQTLSALDHPGIVRPVAWFETNDAMGYAMEFVQGWSPGEFLAGGHWRDGVAAADYRSTPDGLRAAMEIVQQLLFILAYLHERGYVHRDLKVDNLIVDAEGRLTMIDFGLAREADGAGRQLEFGITAAGEVMGTPNYLAPEQIRALPLDGRADLYAAGVICYELTTGVMPFTAGSVADLLHAHLQESPLPPRKRNPALSPELSGFILRLLAKEPAGRFLSAAEALRALRRCGNEDESKRETLDLSSVTAALAQAAPAAPGATPALLAPPWIGNAAAHDTLLAAAGKLLGGTGSAWTLSGATGGGKSRLGDELRAFARENGASFWRGRARAEGGLPGQPFQEFFATVAELHLARPGLDWLGDDGPTLARHFAPLRRLPGCVDEAARTRGGAEDPAQEKARLLAALYGFFQRLTESAPAILVLEDLQWADPLTRELAAHLVANFAGADGRLLLLITHADPAPAEFTQWKSRLAGVTPLSLKPLNAEETAELIAALLGLTGAPPAPFVEKVASLTGGNPYFLIETFQALVADGRLRRAADPRQGMEGWLLDPHFVQRGDTAITLPSTIQALLERRIAALPHDAREALAQAALLGANFEFRWWQRLSGRPEAELLDFADQAIRQKLLIESGGDRLSFEHDQLRAAFLAPLSGLMLRRLHGRALTAILADNQPDPPLDRLSLHALASGDREAAADYGTRRLESLLRGFDLTGAESIRDQMNALLGDWEGLEPKWYRHYLRLVAELHAHQRESKQALEIAQKALGIEGDVTETIKLYAQISYCNRLLRQHDAAIDAANTMLKLSINHGHASERRLALYRLGTAYLFAGNYIEAEKHLNEGITRSKDVNDTYLEGMLLTALGILSDRRGNLQQSLKYHTQSAKAFHEASNNHELARAYTNIGACLVNLGDLGESVKNYINAQSLRIRLGDRHGCARIGCTLAEIAIYQGEFQVALERLTPWQDAVREVDEPLLVADLLSTRALALDWLGRGAEAEPLWHQAYELHRGLQNADDLAQLIASRAHLHLICRNPERALAILKESPLLSDDQESNPTARWITAISKLISILQGDASDLSELEDAKRFFGRLGNFTLSANADLYLGLATAKIGNSEQATLTLREMAALSRSKGYENLARQAESFIEKPLSLSH